MHIKCHSCFNYVIEMDKYVISFTDIYICGNCINKHTVKSPLLINNINVKSPPIINNNNCKMKLKNIVMKIKSYLNF